jgi:hypothetical protein
MHYVFSSNNSIEAFQQENERIDEALRNNKIKLERYSARYDNPLWQFRYAYNSAYEIHLNRFFKLFDKQNILIVLSEEIKT